MSIQVVKDRGSVSPEELAYNVGLSVNYLPLILHGIGSISGGEIVYADRRLMTKSMFQELAARHKPKQSAKRHKLDEELVPHPEPITQKPPESEPTPPTPTPQTPEIPPAQPSEKIQPVASISWLSLTRPYYALECKKGHGRKLKQLGASVETYSEAGERRSKYGRFQCDICQGESVYNFAEGTWLD